MYILSIPSFHWIPLNVSDSIAQVEGACAKLANRCMVTYGGFPTTAYQDNEYHQLKTECNWDSHGLRLVDLSELVWKTRYEGSGTSTQLYTVPSAIHAVIGGNEVGGATRTAPAAEFQTSELATIFAVTRPTSNASSSPCPGFPTDSSAASSPNSHTGAIAGGVVGGVAIVAVISIAYWLCRRRSKRRQAVLTAPMPPFEKDGRPAYNHNHTPIQEMDAVRGVHELNA